MAWLAIPAVGTNNKLPIALNCAMELTKVIGGLKDSLNDLSTRNAVDLLDELASRPIDSTDPVVDAVSRITSKPIEEIIKDWNQLREKNNCAHSVKLRALARNFKELKGEFSHLPKIIEWKLVDADIDKSRALNAEAQLSFKSAIEAVIEFEAYAQIPLLPIGLMTARSDKAVMRLGVDGKLELEGQLGFAAGAVAGHVATESLGHAELDMYFLEEPDTHFGVAAAHNISNTLSNASALGISLDSPLDIGKLSELLYIQDMHCMRLSAEGMLVFDARLGLAKTYNVGEQIKVKAGMEVSATMIEKGAFEYLFAADETNGEKAIAVQVKRAHAQENISGTTFGIEVDPRQLFSKIQPLIEEHLGNAKDALDEFGDLLPGSAILSEALASVIDDHLQDPTLRKEIKVLTGIDASASPEDVFRDRIIGIIETSADGWSANIAAAVPGIVNTIVAGLERYSGALPAVRAKLESIVLAVLEKKHERLKQTITQTVTTVPIFRRIANKLQIAGIALAQDVSTKQKRIDAINAGASELLDRLQRRIGRLQDALQTATEKTLTLRITAERKDKKEEALNLLFYIYPDRDPAAAQQALNAIVLGKMNEVIAQIARLSTGARPAVVGMNGGYVIYESITHMASSELILWNINLGTRSIIDADVRLSVNLDGTVVAQSEAEYMRIDATRKEKRTLTFVESSEMIFATYKNSINVGVTVSHEDEELRVNEVAEFFRGLVSRDLLDPHVIAHAVNILSRSNGRNAVKGRLDVGLTLTKAHLQSMLDSVESMVTTTLCDTDGLECRTPAVICPEGAGKRGCHWVLDTVSEIIAQVVSTQHKDRRLVERLVQVLEVLELEGGLVNGIRVMTPARVRELVGQYHVFESQLHHYNDFADMLGDLSFLEYRRYGAMALYEVLAHMKALIELGSAINPDVAKIQQLPGMTASQLKAHQYRIAQILPVWWHWGHEWKQWAFLTDEMRSLNVAFFESWVNLAKGPYQEGEAPVLWASISLPDSNNLMVPTMLT